MNGNSEHMDDLIAKVLAGEASREEVDVLEGWMNEAKENKIYFDETRKLFARIESFKVEHKVDSVKAWEKLNARISEQQASVSEAKVIPLSRKSAVFRAAATVLLIVTLALVANYVFNNSNGPAPVVLAAQQKVVEDNLPDGSKVTINKNSEVSYSKEKGVRRVRLKGEAYFEVKHKEDEAFEIVVEDIIIRDIGTAFNVKALPESNSVEVYVESGEVHFYSTASKGIYLVKGEKAVYNKTTRHFEKSPPDHVENTISYKSRVFHFRESALREVIRQVNDIYGSNIVLDDQRLGNCLLSTTFNDESIDAVIDIISETLDLSVERSGEKIILKGQPCTE